MYNERQTVQSTHILPLYQPTRKLRRYDGRMAPVLQELQGTKCHPVALLDRLQGIGIDADLDRHATLDQLRLHAGPVVEEKFLDIPIAVGFRPPDPMCVPKTRPRAVGTATFAA